jgi:hypothetical protein
MAALNKLAPLANLGSVLGFVFTVLAFVRQWYTRQHYQLLIRGPEIADDLRKLADSMQDVRALTSQERKTVLRQARTVFAEAAKHMSVGRKISLISTRVRLWWYWNDATLDQTQRVFAEARSLQYYILRRIRDKEVEQA